MQLFISNVLVYTSTLPLHGQVYVGIDIVHDNKQSFQDELWERIKRDPYLEYAVMEAFISLQSVLMDLLNEHGRAWLVITFSHTLCFIIFFVGSSHEALAVLNWCDNVFHIIWSDAFKSILPLSKDSN